MKILLLDSSNSLAKQLPTNRKGTDLRIDRVSNRDQMFSALNNNHYDRIFSSIFPDGGDIEEILNELATRHDLKQTPVVLFSARISEKAVRKYRSLGADNLISEQQVISYITDMAATAQNFQIDILHIEDDRVLRMLMKSLLAQVGNYRVEQFETGQAALEYARSSAARWAFVDINLPDADGRDLARQLRKLPTGEHIKIIAVTGEQLSEDEAGDVFDGVIIKPFSIDSISAIIQ